MIGLEKSSHHLLNQNNTNRDFVSRVFPRLALVTCICFEFSLAHFVRSIYVSCDWSFRDRPRTSENQARRGREGKRSGRDPPWTSENQARFHVAQMKTVLYLPVSLFQ